MAVELRTAKERQRMKGANGYGLITVVPARAHLITFWRRDLYRQSSCFVKMDSSHRFREAHR